MGRKNVIQNDEVLYETLSTGEEFFIPCRDRADAHSKSVSLNNARNRMNNTQQRSVKVQKVEIDGIWGVKISPASKTVILKLVDGKMIPWSPNDNKLSDDNQRMVSLMVKDNKTDEEILEILSEENAELVKKAIALERG